VGCRRNTSGFYQNVTKKSNVFRVTIGLSRATVVADRLTAERRAMPRGCVVEVLLIRSAACLASVSEHAAPILDQSVK